MKQLETVAVYGAAERLPAAVALQACFVRLTFEGAVEAPHPLLLAAWNLFNALKEVWWISKEPDLTFVRELRDARRSRHTQTLGKFMLKIMMVFDVTVYLSPEEVGIGNRNAKKTYQTHIK